MASDSPSAVPAALVALTGWFIPGSGYWLIGQRARAITILCTILLLFILGLLIGGMRVLEPSEPLWQFQQVLGGPMALLGKWIGRAYDLPFSHARVNEIGTLYTAVAGDLSLLAIIDSSFRAHQREAKA